LKRKVNDIPAQAAVAAVSSQPMVPPLQLSGLHAQHHRGGAVAAGHNSEDLLAIQVPQCRLI
jgi:hypothetical protein